VTSLDAIVQLIQTGLLILLVAQTYSLGKRLDRIDKKVTKEG